MITLYSFGPAFGLPDPSTGLAAMPFATGEPFGAVLRLCLAILNTEAAKRRIEVNNQPQSAPLPPPICSGSVCSRLAPSHARLTRVPAVRER